MEMPLGGDPWEGARSWIGQCAPCTAGQGVGVSPDTSCGVGRSCQYVRQFLGGGTSSSVCCVT